ncbi:MAG: HAD family hydrolase [Sneathiella sp.]|jgi:putative hydrolase of the HAD superfamily|uniref:HAD-IA family hydrolase n=1 Tax=Sneathiella sp. TaxID=1964365 RepID=UPI000C4689BA|nr:HAD-IA family hydrolase [Sneathiella sp.]MAL77577.1 HAD family hydrolase [Sneathiella sp.]
MIKAILWDFGGVLTSSPFEAFARYESERGLPENFVRTINSTNPDTNAWARFERSEVTLDEFDTLFEAESAALGHPVSGKDIVRLLGGDIRPNMVNALKICREKYICTCLTNNVAAGKGPGMTRDAAAQADVQKVMGLFGEVIESSKIGLRKPDPRIYEYACGQMGVKPEEVVYLDDLGINLKPAAAMGMTTIKVVSEAQALRDLSAASGLSFS